MSRIDKLIERLCPDGVEYKALENVTTKIVDGSHNVPKEVFSDSSKPMISAKNISGGRIDYSFGRMISPKDYYSESQRTRSKVET